MRVPTASPGGQRAAAGFGCGAMAEEVGAYALQNVINLALADGLDPADLFQGTGLDWRDYVRGSRRADWDPYCDVMERYAERLGGWERMAAVGDRLPEASASFTRAVGAVLTPRQLYKLFERANQVVWRCVTTRVFDEADGALRVECEIAAPYRPCLPLVSASTGAMRSATRRLDLPPARVDVLELSGRRGAWRVVPPRPRPRLQQLGRAFSATWLSMVGESPADAVALVEEMERERTAAEASRALAAHAMAEVTGACFVIDGTGAIVWSSPRGRALLEADPRLVGRLAQGDPGSGLVLKAVPASPAYRVAVAYDADADHAARLAAATSAWDLTRAQAAVLAELARGCTNKEIAARLEIAEATVEVHVTALFRKSGASTRSALVARFWTL